MGLPSGVVSGLEALEIRDHEGKLNVSKSASKFVRHRKLHKTLRI
jgi:hypothetical protein